MGPGLKILFVTGHAALPQLIGGSQRTADTLIRSLRARGHDVEMLAALARGGSLGLRARVIMRARRRPAVSDRVLGYRIWRGWRPWEAVGQVVDRLRPDVAVVLARDAVRMVRVLREVAVPVVLALQDLEFADQGGDIRSIADVAAIANSRFTAMRFEAAFGLKSTVIHPLIDADHYRTDVAPDDPARRWITFVNPHPKKGLDIVLAIAAALPHRRFLFLEAWPMSGQERAALAERVAALGNVDLRAPVEDMRPIYAATKLLLAPSLWEEAYGRVASEAQVAGIPVLGSLSGGLPEAIGEGGRLFPTDAPVAAWVDEIEALLHDPDRYALARHAALAHAGREGLDRARQIAAWEQTLAAVAAGDPPPRADSGDAT